jgi:cardiolipin synthase
LELAALRGVDVRLILPRVSDNPLVHWVSISYAEVMQSKGVLILLYDAGFMHQKVILADDHLSVVGTMNIDNRALYLNFETMVLIHGTAFNAAVASMLQRDFLSCRFLQKERHLLVRSLTRMRANVARLLAPLL